MKRKLTAFSLLALPLVALAAPGNCTSLAKLKLPQATIQSAVLVAAGDKLTLWSGGQPQAMLKAFCRVRGLATPVPGSAIGFEVWLPEAAAWNGKYLQAGNGGTAGAIPRPSLLDGVARGYTTAATDSGHVWPDGLDYGWAAQRPEIVVDFGWRAVQRTTDAAQGIVRLGLGRAPKKSYFMGCSDGGRDAMIVAQRFPERFPERFDGIVSGAPALAWLDMMIGGALLQRELTPPAPGALSVAKLPALQSAVRAACAAGGKYIADPLQCRFDPAVLQCTGADIVQARQRWSCTFDALDPDLGPLKRRGAKLLRYHGWTDAPIPPRISLNYFESVQQRMGDTRDYHRLFMVPGMNHCADGEGPWQVDWLAALERWVEQGEAPTPLTATHPKDGSTQMLRPHGIR